MKFLIILIYIIVLILCFKKKKSVYPISMFASIFSPVIEIGGRRYDGAYVFILVLLILVIACKSIKKPPLALRNYMYLNIYLVCLYLFSWSIYGFHETGKAVAYIIGTTKLLIFMYSCWTIDKNNNVNNIEQQIKLFLYVSVIVNLAAVIFEMVSFEHSVSFFREIFLNSEEANYLVIQTRGNRWTRFYGIFKYPMNMGVFVVFSTLISLKYINMKKKFWGVVFFISNVMLGISSGSKAYMLGIVVLVAAYFCIPLLKRKISNKNIIPYIVLPLLAVLFVVLFDQILHLVTNIFGGGVAYRMEFLLNWTGSLSTRYNSTQGVLRDLPEFIFNHLIIGVGPGSIQGEPNMDNAYFMILHNGGLCALVPVVIYYISLLRKVRKDVTLLVLILGIFLLGIAFQTFVSTEITTWIIYYLSIKSELNKSLLKSVFCRVQRPQMRFRVVALRNQTDSLI